MKPLSFFNKGVFFVNSLFATALLLAYLLPYIPPSTFPFLSILSLGMPILLILNITFLIYWIVKLRKQFLLSFLILLLGFNHILSLYKFGVEQYTKKPSDVKLLSYNVRQFNRYNWIEADTVTKQIIQFVGDQKPDILCFQEYDHREDVSFSSFKNQYRVLLDREERFGQAILTNYPIINKGAIGFENSNNNAIYTDLLIAKDTVRVINIHLESLKINPSVSEFHEKNRQRLVGRMSTSFKKQEVQVQKILENLNNCPYKSVICGDMNNSAFSYVYRKLAQNHVDAFKEKGESFGKTFVFDFIPLRIDAILVDESMEVKAFDSHPEIRYSDHYPISCVFSLTSDN
ncbi:endonuclease/exonuclease/phosphatase family protein [Mesonia aestuariivivens]|uniref:Endonuclease/exonuclease/phosphatase family protein n=1 Tax=Mesonia aestuariivivens TaxID=2796128 RepID=A0ABS6VZY5_9FLAO|nr:endonuclease/exonuclease/phosphatase family protein [Mesonia aestuariivivens]MBW2961149.1 endonuclease/exonuclease/phosphatase family protein [Mesonia aestuariivivens]